jgi:GH24 family phage-related lysozyme (muramidase)
MKRLLTIFSSVLFLATFTFCSSVKEQVTILPPHSFKEYITKWEGYRHQPYSDSGGWTVGIGHRLPSGWAVKGYYSDDEIDSFYQADYQRALASARAGVEGFDSLPQQAQWVTLSLIWTVGPTSFEQFVAYRSALSRHFYTLAAQELGNSKWYYQVAPARANDHYQALSHLTTITR